MLIPREYVFNIGYTEPSKPPYKVSGSYILGRLVKVSRFSPETYIRRLEMNNFRVN